MNNDRELLELAAKAAGIKGKFGDKFNIGTDEVDCTDLFFVDNDVIDSFFVWNPLTDDGDALRLAVKLEMDLSLGLNGCVVLPDPNIKLEELSSNDPYAATRRAIVRAAAEIGRTM